MMPLPSQMILECVDKIKRLGETERSAFVKVLSFAASRANVSGVITESFSEEQYEFLNKNFNIDCLKDAFGDWFTHALEIRGILPRTNYERLNIIKKDILNAINKCKGNPLLLLFLPPQTGRLVSLVFQELKDDAIYVAVEPEILQYKIILFNATLYNMPVIALNGNPDLHNLELSSKNWDFANMWVKPAWGQMEGLNGSKN